MVQHIILPQLGIQLSQRAPVCGLPCSVAAGCPRAGVCEALASLGAGLLCSRVAKQQLLLDLLARITSAKQVHYAQQACTVKCLKKQALIICR